MEKRLYKSRNDVKIAGVCAGIGEFFGIDPTIIRLVWGLSILGGGIGILAYILCMFIIPENY